MAPSCLLSMVQVAGGVMVQGIFLATFWYLGYYFKKNSLLIFFFYIFSLYCTDCVISQMQCNANC